MPREASCRPAEGRDQVSAGPTTTRSSDEPASEELLRQVGTLPGREARSGFFLHHPQLVSAETVFRIRDIVLRELRVDVHTALNLAEAAMEVAQRLRDPAANAHAFRCMANAMYANGQHRSAIEHHHRAIELFQSLKDEDEVARTLSSSIQPLLLLGDYEAAVQAADRARESFVRRDDRWPIAMLRATREACKANQEQYHYALCHMDLSEIYLELNLSEEAAEMATQGAALFESLAMGYETAKCYANQATAMGQQKQAFRAMELFSKAREIFVREQNAVWPSLIDLYQALLLFNEGRYFESRSLCHAALDVFSSSALQGKAVLCH